VKKGAKQFSKKKKKKAAYLGPTWVCRSRPDEEQDRYGLSIVKGRRTRRPVRKKWLGDEGTTLWGWLKIRDREFPGAALGGEGRLLLINFYL